MQAVVLAAGKGTRLRPVTANRSKAMVPVLGRPLVERALKPFVENGVRDFVFVVSPEDAEITRYFTECTSLDIAARFVTQEERLGTAHALGIAAPYLRGRFAVTACDSLVDASHVRDLLAKGDGADAVAAEVRKLHDAGIHHPDLNLGNILAAGSQIHLIGYDRARQLGRPLTRGERYGAQSRMYRSLAKLSLPREPALSPEDKNHFLAAYWPDEIGPHTALRRRCRRELALHRIWWRFNPPRTGE